MIILDSGDKIQGDAAVASVLDYTIYGLDKTHNTLKQLADEQLPNSIGDLYTSTSIITAIAEIILVNTDSVARAVNLFMLPSGGTARRIIPKDLSLGAKYSLHTDGRSLRVYDDSGTLQVAALYADHAFKHESAGADELFDQNLNTTDDVQFGEITLTPKASSTGAEGTLFYDSDDDHVYVATE